MFLIIGADELGFPAYSVVAGAWCRRTGGRKIGGVCDSLREPAGFIAHYVRKAFPRSAIISRSVEARGTVEDVGFSQHPHPGRQKNSLLSIPNNTVVNTTVENLTLRTMRRQRFFLQITYDTPRDKVEALVEGVRQILTDHPLTNKTNFQVRFNNLAESSKDILVLFYLNVQDYTTELSEREAILFQTIDLADQIGVEFAFPTRTLQVETALPASGPPTTGLSPRDVLTRGSTNSEIATSGEASGWLTVVSASISAVLRSLHRGAAVAGTHLLAAWTKRRFSRPSLPRQEPTGSNAHAQRRHRSPTAPAR